MQASVAEASTSHYAAVAIDQPSKGAVASSDLSVLPRIYGSDTNLAIWRRNIAGECQSESAKWLERNPTLQLSLMASPETIQQSIISTLRVDQDSPLVKDMAELVEMFCVLFELTRVGFRLTALQGQMCPKFHVDRVPCRLITTYVGIATEWLPNDKTDRSKLGAVMPGIENRQGGLYKQDRDIAQLNTGDVALFKGEAWEGNEGFGVVHRSPSVPDNTQRLLLTIDFGK
jgi:hypothetical protein